MTGQTTDKLVEIGKGRNNKIFIEHKKINEMKKK